MKIQESDREVSENGSRYTDRTRNGQFEPAGRRRSNIHVRSSLVGQASDAPEASFKPCATPSSYAKAIASLTVSSMAARTRRKLRIWLSNAPSLMGGELFEFGAAAGAVLDRFCGGRFKLSARAAGSDAGRLRFLSPLGAMDGDSGEESMSMHEPPRTVDERDGRGAANPYVCRAEGRRQLS